MKLKFVMSTIATSTFLVACSSSSISPTEKSPGTAPETVRYLGELFTSTFDEQRYMLIRGFFFSYAENIGVERLKRIMDFNNIDKPGCVIKDNNADSEGEFIPDSANPQFVSAGDVLVLTSPMGTFANVQKFENDAGLLSPSYANTVNLPLFPENLRLSIPGDEFSAFDVPMPHVAKLETEFKARDTPIKLNTEITWTPETNDNALIALRFSDDPAVTHVDCVSRDTGSFTLPQAVVDYFGSNQAMLLNTITRTKTTFHYTADTMLVITTNATPMD